MSFPLKYHGPSGIFSGGRSGSSKANMKKKIQRTCAALLLTVLVLPASAPAVERTGEVLRELLKGVEKDFETMERKTQGFSEQAATLSKDLEEKAELIGQTQDPVRKETLKADALFLAAKLNELDRKDVGVALKTINQVRSKLDRMRDVVRRGGVYPAERDFPRVRQRMGRFLSTAAEFLDRWEKSSPARKSEVASLKATLIGVVNKWESPTANIDLSPDQIERTVRALDTTYSQLLTLARSLEQERQYLLVRNNAAVARLALIRLNGGKVNISSVSGAVESKQKAIRRRREIIGATDTGVSLPAGKDGGGLGSDQEAVFDRIRRGDFKWSKGGSQ